MKHPYRLAILVAFAVCAAGSLRAQQSLVLDANHRPTRPVDLGSPNWTGTLDPARLPYDITTIPASDADGVTDCRADIQAAIDALPSNGGIFLFPPGNVFIHGTINVTKKIRWIGTNQGNAGEASDNTGAGLGNSIITDNTNVSLFLVSGGTGDNGNACSFEYLSFFGTATTPTAGAFIEFTNATGMSASHCGFCHGWNDIIVTNGYYWSLDHCVLQSSRSHALTVDDAANEDNGDNSVISCVFGGGGCVSGAAAIYHTGASGLRMIDDKVNGPYYGGPSAPYPGFTYGYYGNFGANGSDVIIASCSIENVQQNCIRIDTPAANDGLANINIQGGNIGLCGGAPILVGSNSPAPNSSYFGIESFLIGGINFVGGHSPSIEIDRAHGGFVGTSTHNNNPATAVLLGANSQYVTVAPQISVQGVATAVVDDGTNNTVQSIGSGGGGGSVDGTDINPSSIGATAPGTGAFTTLTNSGAFSSDGNQFASDGYGDLQLAELTVNGGGLNVTGVGYFNNDLYASGEFDAYGSLYAYSDLSVSGPTQMDGGLITTDEQGDMSLNGVSTPRLIVTPVSSPPNAPTEGEHYYSNVTHHEFVWNGTTWKQLDN